jgi:hypothetical protein
MTLDTEVQKAQYHTSGFLLPSELVWGWVSIPDRGGDYFPFTIVPRLALGPTKRRIRWVPRPLSVGVKWPGRESNHTFHHCRG